MSDCGYIWWSEDSQTTGFGIWLYRIEDCEIIITKIDLLLRNQNKRKSEVCNTCRTPVSTYDPGTWALFRNQENKLKLLKIL